MKVWIKLLLCAGLVLVGGAAILVYVALRDSPARPAVGEARVAPSGEATIEYRAGGATDGPLVILFPSFGRSAADFNELVDDLGAAGYRTLAVQPRGIEGSTLPSGDPTYHTYADDIAAVLDAEEADGPVHVLGHAYGNRIARTFATDYPERTRSVVLLAAGGAEPTPPEIGEAIGTAMLGIASEGARRDAIARAFFAEGNAVDDDWMRGWYPRAGLAEMEAAKRTPYEEWGDAGSAPILVLQPAEDTAAANGGRLLEEAHPQRVHLVEVEGAGHAILPERPEFVSLEILRFLAEHR